MIKPPTFQEQRSFGCGRILNRRGQEWTAQDLEQVSKAKDNKSEFWVAIPGISM